MYYCLDTFDGAIRQANDVNAFTISTIFTCKGMMRPYLQHSNKVFETNQLGEMELIKEFESKKQAEQYFIKHCLSEGLIVSENENDLKGTQAELFDEWEAIEDQELEDD